MSTTTDYPATKSSAEQSTGSQSSQQLKPSADLIDYVSDYAAQKPQVAALWCLGIGFVLGWKLKPW